MCQWCIYLKVSTKVLCAQRLYKTWSSRTQQYESLFLSKTYWLRILSPKLDKFTMLARLDPHWLLSIFHSPFKTVLVLNQGTTKSLGDCCNNKFSWFILPANISTIGRWSRYSALQILRQSAILTSFPVDNNVYHYFIWNGKKGSRNIQINGGRKT